ncbi:antibiotic biosynthesis monooxygenase [Mumia flava]|uniref:Antibiotic biosynthesis monooxygenase n=1 Tax=Mumia flava TaxID=1348852 RepID=A0A0B2B6J6_9ACTN|nr:antibiotic biosynthesis monooxygenase [Mumia flava]PJJ53978.1 antibiotic biosynthesis monooxygenase [Mumia flava]
MSDPVTFINVVDVDASTQQEVVDLLREAVEDFFSHRPGFLSATVLASPAGDRVVTVARWRSAEDAAANGEQAATAEYGRRLSALATPNPGTYATVAEYAA